MEKHEQRFQVIKRERQEVKNLIKELVNNEGIHKLSALLLYSTLRDINQPLGWTLVRETDGVKTHYRHEDSTPVHSIKMEGVINSPALNIMAIMNEHSLYDTWIPLLKAHSPFSTPPATLNFYYPNRPSTYCRM